MAFNKDSVAGTFLFTIVLCLLCSFMITGTAGVLKERKLAKQRNELMQNVLLAADIPSDNSNFKTLFGSRVIPMLVTLADGQRLPQDDLLDYDERMAAINPQSSSKIAKDIARIKTRANQIRIFRVDDAQGKLQSWVLPIYGKGLWSIIYGFIGLTPDLNTVEAVVFYEHGETPGIGDFINHQDWRQKWHGKQLFDANGKLALKIVKGGAKAGDLNGIDGVSGATRTGAGVQNMISFWFGDEGFTPLLAKLKAMEAAK
ncbi:Na(+)-translocating NADH-quinone reductase subunit C [Shewanella sp. A32]|uniref:Na(+)-translocating NADH-quinone reductase subunit C n=1 Tax=Shewanella sp. A32 TaxID=3031327 RepID=UPI0023B8ABE0|nr:Na(+)-translocating NADH-quinone reductase subunit C [Shewanella sp. A32]MDF0533964.1 Na(+)-translocating NADH-quinone reductase subunit C [Shewanella sp. A32]